MGHHKSSLQLRTTGINNNKSTGTPSYRPIWMFHWIHCKEEYSGLNLNRDLLLPHLKSASEEWAEGGSPPLDFQILSPGMCRCFHLLLFKPQLFNYNTWFWLPFSFPVNGWEFKALPTRAFNVKCCSGHWNFLHPVNKKRLSTPLPLPPDVRFPMVLVERGSGMDGRKRRCVN